MASIISATTTNGLSTSADNSGSLQLATNNGTTAVTIDTSQNVGIGTSSPQTKLNVSGGTIRNTGTNGILEIQNGNTAGGVKLSAYNAALSANGYLAFEGYSVEYGRFDSSGNLCVNRTSAVGGGKISIQGVVGGGGDCITTIPNISGTYNPAVFYDNGGTIRGFIQTSTTTTTFGTSSDYRLKENIAPMTGALATVQALKPVTYKWKVDGSDGQGFIAHELQAVVPDCVTGEKDGVDEEGNPVHQGVDTSFLVATLTAAIQELKAELDATKAEVQALKGVA